MAAPRRSVARGQRDSGLDAARALAMALVVAGHAAVSFMVTPVGWAVQDRSRNLGVDLCAWIIRAFAMPMFFWLSGYWSRAVMQRGGLGGFLRNRATRIFAPLAIGLVPCSLLLDALWDCGRAVGDRGVVAANIPKLAPSELPIGLGHLWFLYYLLLLSLAAVVGTRVAARVRRPGVAARIPALAVPAIAIAAALLAIDALQPDTPLGFVPDLAILVYSGGFFAWGWLVHARPDELDRYRSHAWRAIAIAAAVLAIVCVTLYRGLEAAADPPGYAVVASGAFSVLCIIGLLGLCARYSDRPRALVRLGADASYWCYVTHLPIVVALQIALAHVALPGIVKYLAIVAVTIAACVASYAAFRGVRRSSRSHA
jgi:peptidoglycan/LPS O-acetylase OafA/YrhL